MNTQLSGRFGEATAAEYLRKKGWRVVGMNYRTRLGEIDVIAEKGRYLAFVEVKLRSAGAIGLPREFVDARKQERLRKAAACYLSTHGLDAPARFDVAEVYTDEGHRIVRLEYLADAFQ